jgi:hypothetical protein
MALAVRSSIFIAGGATVTEPAGASATDILVAFVIGPTANTQPPTTTGTWVQDVSRTYNTASEVITTWTLNRGAVAPNLTWGGTVWGTIIWAITGADQTTWVDAPGTALDNATSTTPSSPSITTVTANALILTGLANWLNPVITAPAGVTQDQNSTSTGFAAGHFTQVVAGATGTKQWTMASTDVSGTFTMAIRPAGTAGSTASAADTEKLDTPAAVASAQVAASAADTEKLDTPAAVIAAQVAASAADTELRDTAVAVASALATSTATSASTELRDTAVAVASALATSTATSILSELIDNSSASIAGLVSAVTAAAERLDNSSAIVSGQLGSTSILNELQDVGTATSSSQIATTSVNQEQLDQSAGVVSSQVAISGANTELLDQGVAITGAQATVTVSGSPTELLDGVAASTSAQVGASGVLNELNDAVNTSISAQIAQNSVLTEQNDLISAQLGQGTSTATSTLNEAQDASNGLNSTQIALNSAVLEGLDANSAISGTLSDISGAITEQQEQIVFLGNTVSTSTASVAVTEGNDASTFSDTPIPVRRSQRIPLNPIRDESARTKGYPLLFKSGIASARGIVVSIKATIRARGTTLTLNSGIVKASEGTRNDSTRAIGSRLTVTSGVSRGYVDAKVYLWNTQLFMRTGFVTAYMETKTYTVGKQLYIRSGTVDDTFGGKNPSDSELAQIAYQLTKHLL